MMTDAPTSFQVDTGEDGKQVLSVVGDWTVWTVALVEEKLRNTKVAYDAILDVSRLDRIDTSGCYLIDRALGAMQADGTLDALVTDLGTKARGAALSGADLVVVVGTPLDFRLGYGVFGGKDGAPPARVVHLADSPGQVSGHAELAGSVAGDLTLFSVAVFLATLLRRDRRR